VDQLQALAKELVDLELQSHEHPVQVLERELTLARDDLTKGRDNFDRAVKDRYDGLLDRAKKKRP
jgi:hypothetical protein